MDVRRTKPGEVETDQNIIGALVESVFSSKGFTGMYTWLGNRNHLHLDMKIRPFIDNHARFAVGGDIELRGLCDGFHSE